MAVTVLRSSRFVASIAFGERYGLYEIIAREGPVTTQYLANVSALPEAIVRDWLDTQAAGHYLVRSSDGQYQSWCELPPR